MKNNPLIDLSGKCALVTGGSRGIGAAVCRQLASAGANIMVGYRARKADAEKVVEECRSLGVTAASFAADVSTANLQREAADRMDLPVHAKLSLQTG